MFSIKRWRLRIKQSSKVSKVVIGQLFVYFLMVSFFVGCMPVSGTPSEIGVSSPTDTPVALPTVTPPSVQPTLVATQQPLTFYFPEVEKRCPENREVPFSELGISLRSLIILSNLENTELWSYSVDNSTPVLLKTLPSNTWMTSYSLNPTSESLAFVLINHDGLYSIWILSLDSGSQAEIFANKFNDTYPFVRWISSDELLLGGNCRGPFCPFPVKVFNVTDNSVVDVEEASDVSLDRHEGFFLTHKKYYALYSSNRDSQYTQFYVYDYSIREKVLALPWLDNKIFFYPLMGTNLNLSVFDNNLAMLVKQSYGFDVGIVNLDLEKTTQNMPYDLMMKRIFTDVSFGDLDYFVINVNPSNRNLLMNINYVDYLIDDVESRNVTDALFVVDVVNPIMGDGLDRLGFIDYCFTTTGYFNQGFSPDGQVAVFSSDDEIAFLNLKTGYISRLSGWSYVGWVK